MRMQRTTEAIAIYLMGVIPLVDQVEKLRIILKGVITKTGLIFGKVIDNHIQSRVHVCLNGSVNGIEIILPLHLDGYISAVKFQRLRK